eukprot:766393-Hanusia_phi.AAC.5
MGRVGSSASGPSGARFELTGPGVASLYCLKEEEEAEEHTTVCLGPHPRCLLTVHARSFDAGPLLCMLPRNIKASAALSAATTIIICKDSQHQTLRLSGPLCSNIFHRLVSRSYLISLPLILFVCTHMNFLLLAPPPPPPPPPPPHLPSPFFSAACPSAPGLLWKTYPSSGRPEHDYPHLLIDPVRHYYPTFQCRKYW